eukprot:TRINITY_DN687_c0_g1_i1.p1 TRINITY_DN687_c0_g1~~TRINITY_DN687_c0_g1_i1.p1  ORF type:complete len:232 (-),score=67.72 TRINITY_DN687_c0_g1_i1:110-805(-)
MDPLQKEKKRFAALGLKTSEPEEDQEKRLDPHLREEFLAKQKEQEQRVAKQNPDRTKINPGVLSKEQKRLGNIESRPSGWNGSKQTINVPTSNQTATLVSPRKIQAPTFHQPQPAQLPPFQQQQQHQPRQPQQPLHAQPVQSFHAPVTSNVKPQIRGKEETYSFTKSTPMTEVALTKELKRMENIESRPSGWNTDGKEKPPKHEDQKQTSRLDKEKQRFQHLGLAVDSPPV